MAKSIYITITETAAGKSIVSLGIMNLLKRKTSRVGYFRPFVDGNEKEGVQDPHIRLMKDYFELPFEDDEMFAFYRNDAHYRMTHGDQEHVLEEIVKKYKEMEDKCDFVLVEGTNFDEATSAYEFSFNALVAKNLGTPIMLVEKGHNRSSEEIIRSIQLAEESFKESGARVLGVIVNRVSDNLRDELSEKLDSALPDSLKFHSIIKSSDVLAYPSVQEVVDGLNAKVLYGKDQLGRQIKSYSIAAMQLPQYLDRASEGALIITPGDRGDIIVGCLLANNSINYPNFAGILLTTGHQPGESILKLVDGLANPIPILAVEPNTFEAAELLHDVKTYLSADNRFKISTALRLFEECVDLKALDEKIVQIEPTGMTPKMFEYNLIKKAQKSKKHIVLPEGEDERVLEAAEDLIERDVVSLTLLGDPEIIIPKAKSLGIDISNIPIIKPCEDERREKYAEKLVELRKHKGLTIDAALDFMCDVSYFGTMMIYCGDADGMVSGAAHTTQHTIRPALQIIKTVPEATIVSSVFFMCLEDRVVIYGDCAVNPNPNAEELAEIAIQSAKTSLAFGIEPRVAMLSYSSGSSGKGEEVEKVRKATAIVKKKWPELMIEGPIQYDAAVDKGVGLKKMPDSKVAGQATVLIFPDLNTGNNTYKAVQRETKALAIGPLLQGLNKPVNDLSRGCLVADIVNTVAMTAVQTEIGKE